MLSNAKLPRSFLGKVIATTCYLINKGLSITIEFKRTVEWWNGGLVVFENLRIFWSPPYVHVNEGKL